MGIPESVEVIPVKKARRVPPEEEGAYIISLPKGSTERTKKIMGQKVQGGLRTRNQFPFFLLQKLANCRVVLTILAPLTLLILQGSKSVKMLIYFQRSI